MNDAPGQRPIVVGYDASDCAIVALKWAGQFAQGAGAPVRALHACPTVLQTGGLSYAPGNAAADREYAEQIAQDGVERLQAEYPDVSVDSMTSNLSPTMALDDASTTASLIVVGSHGRGRLGAVLLGSTAYAVSGHARCPVVVVRDAHSPVPGPTHPILVGSDGSVGSERALDAAADMATQCNAPLSVLTAWNPPPLDPWDRPPMGYGSVEECLTALDAQADARNAAALARVRAQHPELDVQGSVREIRPDDGLISQGGDAALIVLGSRGHSALMGALLGSTARSVLHHVATPVMVVH